ncbi:MAG: CinA family protein [Chloroflexi bacterium CFX1]|nr:CinA family protein [Chloroflexi bacterium CFX1]MCQ3952393.1 CinA family protein [Chloroflexota bacterium]MDL1917987.1 CinA family protein [Chloroflexi bacterium CFX5]NUQ59338.1 CinA family protein [Anaerolineales bacterium]
MTLESRIGDVMNQKRLTLAAAESCTGGLVSSRITDVPGSSAYFLGGVVAYSYEAKASLLGVSWDTLNKYGAVSRETVIEMARGARKLFNADIAVSISGIAGPGGGTDAKPVGTVWVGLSASGGEEARHFVWEGDRILNKQLSSEAAMQFILDYLEGKLE